MNFFRSFKVFCPKGLEDISKTQLWLSRSCYSSQSFKRASSLISFIKEKNKAVFQANPGIPSKRVVQIIAEMWRNLSDEEKQAYRKSTIAANDEYRRREKSYIENMPKDEWLAMKGINDKKTRSLVRKVEYARGRPKLPLPAFFSFMLERKALMPQHAQGKTPRVFAQETGRIWNNLSDEERMVYKNKHKELLAEYHMQMMEWKRQEGIEKWRSQKPKKTVEEESMQDKKKKNKGQMMN